MAGSPEAARQFATRDQAAALLTEISTVTTLYGRNHADVTDFSATVRYFPSLVAGHVEPPEDPSVPVIRSVYLVHGFDGDSGRPVREGSVASISFMQLEGTVQNPTISTHVNYHVITQEDGEGVYDIERGITMTSEEEVNRRLENLGHALMIMDDSEMLAMIEPPDAAEEEHRLDEAERLEDATGLPRVLKPEAAQLIRYVKKVRPGGRLLIPEDD